MTEVWQSVMAGLGTLILTALVGLLTASVKTYKAVGILVTSDAKRSRQMQALFQVTASGLKASRATLEVVSGMKANGNVKEAMDHLDAAEGRLEEFSCAEAWR